jgi:hypothetical protein
MPGTGTPLPLAGHRSLKADLEAAERQHQRNLESLARSHDRLAASGLLLSDAGRRARAMDAKFARRLTGLLDSEFDDHETFLQAVRRSFRREGSENYA